MRDAFARADNRASSGRKRGNASRRAAAARRPFILRLLTGATSRPGTTTLALVGVGLLSAILVNALMLQEKRHPAPLFNEFAAAPALRPVVRPQAAPPAPVPRQTASAPAAPEARKPDSIGQLLQGGAPAATSSANANGSDKTAAIPRRDSIGQLLKTGALPAESAATADSTVDRTVLNAQKALTRLGYGLRADGKAGAATKQAIEKFERSRRLPVTGELNARTRRELAALSGMPLD